MNKIYPHTAFYSGSNEISWEVANRLTVNVRLIENLATSSIRKVVTALDVSIGTVQNTLKINKFQNRMFYYLANNGEHLWKPIWINNYYCKSFFLVMTLSSFLTHYRNN